MLNQHHHVQLKIIEGTHAFSPFCPPLSKSAHTRAFAGQQNSITRLIEISPHFFLFFVVKMF